MRNARRNAHTSITRRRMLQGLTCCAGIWSIGRTSLANAASLAPLPPGGYSTKAVALVQSTHVIDMLCNVNEARVVKGGPNEIANVFERMRRWNTDPTAISDEQLRRYRESGINTFHVSPEIRAFYPDLSPYERARRFLDGWRRIFEQRPDLFTWVRTGAELDDAPWRGRPAVILGIQNGDHFRSPTDVEEFWQLGQRVSQLTYNEENHLGGGAFADVGLKPAGRETIRAMNRAGMVVDLSHANNRTALEAAEATEITPIVSHTNCQALTPGFLRNLNDDVIRAVARKGGVIGLTVLRQFVSLKEPTTLRDFIRHVDHVVDLVGIEHVGIGSDNDLVPFDGVDDEAKRKYFSQPAQKGYQWRERAGIDGLDHHRRIYDIVEALLKRGYSDQHVRMVLGDNFRRVLSEIWASRQAEGLYRDKVALDEAHGPDLDKKELQARFGAAFRIETE